LETFGEEGGKKQVDEELDQWFKKAGQKSNTVKCASEKRAFVETARKLGG